MGLTLAEIMEARTRIAGLAGGVAVAGKAIRPDIRVVGITMARGAAMHASLMAGYPVEVAEVPSLSDSLGCGIGLDNRLSFPLCRHYLDETVLVSEEDIYLAMQALYHEDRLVAEGASVVGIAAVMAGKVDLAPGPVATILTGRNPDMGLFTRVVTGQDVVLGSYIVEGTPYAP